MNIAYLSHGQTLRMNKKDFRIERHLESEIQLVDLNSSRAMQMTYQSLLAKIKEGEIDFQVNSSPFVAEHVSLKKKERISALFENYPPPLQNEMRTKRAFLETYLKKYGDVRSQRLIAEGVEEFWNDKWGKPPHPASVARWLKRYIECNKDIRSLCSAMHLKGNRVHRYDDLIVNACHSAIQKIYLTRERGSIQKTLSSAIREINYENNLRPLEYQLALPTKSFISSLIKQIPAYDVYCARFGRSVADHKFRNAIHSVTSQFPLERVEIDHTRLDLIVVDELTGIAIGRPWLTLVIDQCTKSILGFCLGFDPPSHMTVARALKMALLPKTDIQKRWPSLKSDWPMFGLMQNLVVDNGLEFHGNSLEDACFTLGINISYCPRKKGWWKATVERAIGTLNRSVTDGLPGRTFSNTRERSEYKSEKLATLTLELLEELTAKWIVDIYHHTVHNSLGKKPISVWHEMINMSEIPIITNLCQLDAILGVHDKRVLSHRGIEINNLFYNSDDLGLVRQKFGNLKDITIKWHPDDLGYIHVLPPDGTLLKVPVATAYKEYAEGLSHYEHQLYKQFSKEHLNEKNNELTLQEAKEVMQDLIQNGSKKVAKNKRLFVSQMRKKKLAKTPEKEQAFDKQTYHPPVIYTDSKVEIPKFEVKQSNRTSLRDKNDE